MIFHSRSSAWHPPVTLRRGRNESNRGVGWNRLIPRWFTTKKKQLAGQIWISCTSITTFWLRVSGGSQVAGQALWIIIFIQGWYSSYWTRWLSLNKSFSLFIFLQDVWHMFLEGPSPPHLNGVLENNQQKLATGGRFFPFKSGVQVPGVRSPWGCSASHLPVAVRVRQQERAESCQRPNTSGKARTVQFCEFQTQVIGAIF